MKLISTSKCFGGRLGYYSHDSELICSDRRADRMPQTFT